MEKVIKPSPKGQDLSLRYLIDIKAWQKIQNNFSVITDVGLRTVDPKGKLITTPSAEPRLCTELLKSSPMREKLCGGCSPTFLGGRGVVDRNLSFICCAGLCNYVIPLRFEGLVLGYLILGPVILVMRKPKEEYRKSAEELSLELEDFWNAILEIKVVSFQGMQSLVELMKDVGEYTIKLAYQNIIQGKEMTVAADSPKLNRLLNALLEVAFQVTGADIGSIMFFEKGHNEMTIRASKGIPEEVVRNTRVKLGNGISGIAAAERTSFLIDDEVRDNRIKPYLNRPYINSSMVLPINVKDRVMGVVNLGTLRTSSVKFNSNNLKLMNKLIDLTTVALHE